MSVETITIVISAAGLALSLAASFAWLIRRADAQLDRFGTQLDARFTRLENRFDERFAQFDARFAQVERELVEVKIAVARIEGPPRHLITAR